MCLFFVFLVPMLYLGILWFPGPRVTWRFFDKSLLLAMPRPKRRPSSAVELCLRAKSMQASLRPVDFSATGLWVGSWDIPKITKPKPTNVPYKLIVGD